MPDIDIDQYPPRLSDPQQNTMPMTPMHDPSVVPMQQSPISPGYGTTIDLPHYELMIVNALEAINNPNGCPPKEIWEWMNKYVS